MTSEAPERAFVLRMKICADTRRQLAGLLYAFADRIDRDDVTKGTMGGSVSGAVYELLVDETQTHDEYFIQLDKYLAKHAQEAQK